MRASLRWLRRHADLPGDARELADRLTMAGYVVAAVEESGEDRVLDVEVTYNRPDLLSHRGIARELAGVCGVPLRPLESAVPSHVASADTVPVAVEAGDLCPLYTARVIRGVRVGPSPAWLVAALEAAGQRSVNNVVDVTNWVMLETGQPLHAFDLAKLAGPRIVVRRARGEPFVAIDGKNLDVGPDDLAICDANGPVALAGVMGGRDSEVSSQTTDILLESAVFAPLAIRATSRRHQLRSESSFRFERFVDTAGTVESSDLAARLFVELCGAASVGPVVSAGPGRPVHGPTISLRAARVAHVLGMPVADTEIRAILESLGLREESGAGGPGAVISLWQAPSWRTDLVEEIDLIEEIGRRVGFDRVPGDRALATRPRVDDPRARALRRLRDLLVACGLRECVNAPFVGAGPLDIDLLGTGPALRVLNPMRTDENLLRRSLAGPLLATARRNRERDVPAVRLFELAPIYAAGQRSGETVEGLAAAGVINGTFFDAKGCVESALAGLGLAGSAEYVRGAPRPLRSDRSATVRIGGAVVGVIGELSDRTAARYGLGSGVAVFELHAGALVAAARLDRPYEPISRFPAVERDLAWVVDESVSWAAIEAAVRGGGGALLRSVTFLSAFRGAQLGAGRKSVALRLELRAPDRTLSGADADACVAAIRDRLAAATGGTLRS